MKLVKGFRNNKKSVFVQRFQKFLGSFKKRVRKNVTLKEYAEAQMALSQLQGLHYSMLQHYISQHHPGLAKGIKVVHKTASNVLSVDGFQVLRRDDGSLHLFAVCGKKMIDAKELIVYNQTGANAKKEKHEAKGK